MLYRLRHRNVYPPGWSHVARAEIARQPYCSFCSSARKLQVHHVVPLHVDSSKGATPSNLMVLCQPCHLYEAHCGDFQRFYDPAIRDRASRNLQEVERARALRIP